MTRRMLEAFGDAHAIVRPDDLHICYVSAPLTEMLGGVDVVGEPVGVIFGRTDRDLASEEVRRSVGGAAVRAFLAEVAGPTPVRLSWRVRATETGVVELLGRRSTEDVSRMRDLDRLFSLSLDMLCIAGFDTYFRWVNPAFTRVLGHTREELVSRSFLDFIHPDDVERTRSEVSNLAAGMRTIDFENRYRRADGSFCWVAWRALPVMEEQRIYAVARDIDARKDVERMKDEFVSTVSHELRTPLTSIHGALGLIESGAAGELSPAVRRLIDVARRNSDRLVRLVDDILDIEKVKAGRRMLKRVPVALSGVVRRAVTAAEGLAAEYGVRFELDDRLGAAVVDADAHRIEQVISNLLSNAAKFSEPGATIWVRGRIAGIAARVEVEDRAGGIPAEFRDRVFERFEQAEPARGRTIRGTGLGLAIARALIEEHEGTLEFETRVGDGTTFWFEIPCRVPGSEPRSETSAPPSSAPPSSGSGAPAPPEAASGDEDG